MHVDEIDAVFNELLGTYYHNNWTEHPYQFLFDYGTAQIEAWEQFKSVAQSPIELRLGAHLLFASDGYKEFIFDDTPPGGAWETRLHPQRRFGKYKVDFCVSMKAEGHIAQIVIECDGHDYHERTKEQAQKDRERDRWFQTRDIKVLRFTGSEIYKDTASCCEQIEVVVHNEMTRLMTAAGYFNAAAD